MAKLIPEYSNDMFMDFFNSIQYGWTPYKHIVNYPPFMNLIYAIIGEFNIIGISGAAIRATRMGILTFSFYLVVVYSSLFWIIYQMKNGEIAEKVLFVIIMLLSLPFIFVFERGNSVVLSLVCVLIYLKFYKSEKNIYKYSAFLFLSFAAGIKISPALFGILLIKDKRYRDGFICAALGFIVFMVPVIFTGGTIEILLHNIDLFTEAYQGTLITGGNKVLLGQGIFVDILSTGKILGRLLNYDFINAVVIGKLSLFILGVLTVCLNKNLDDWKAYGIISGLIILTPGFSAIYNLIYIIIPLIAFLNERRKKRIIDFVCLVLFVCMLIPLANYKDKMFEMFFLDLYPVYFSTYIESLALLLFVVLLVFDSIIYSCRNKNIETKRKKNYLAFIICVFIGIITYVYGYKARQPIKAFYPYNLDAGNASEGFILKNGMFKNMLGKGTVKLQVGDLLEKGLTLSFAKEDLPIEDQDVVQLYVNNKLVGQCNVSNHGIIYVEPRKMREVGIEKNDKSIETKIVYNAYSETSKKSQSLNVLYLGPAIGLTRLGKNVYIDEAASGFIKKGNDLWLSKEGKFLFDASGKHKINFIFGHQINDENFDAVTRKTGIKIIGSVPTQWSQYNQGKIPILTISSSNGNVKKQLPLQGNFALDISLKELGIQDGDVGTAPILIDLSMNGIFNSKKMGFDNDTSERSIMLKIEG